MKNFLLPLVFVSSTLAMAEVTTPVTNIPSAQVLDQSIELNDQAIYFINRNSVRVRSLPASDPKSKILGEISLNDNVKIINPTIIYDNKFVEVVIVKTYDKLESSAHYFITIDTLSPKIVDYKEFTGKYFVVVNVATETIRLYERVCADNSCPNKMLMESEVVVGEDVNHPKDAPGKGRSLLGSYRVVGWSKFYQDPEAHYPAWYRDGYPDVPKADASWNAWFSKNIMPKDIEGKTHGKMRGAFGWYTAFVEPEPFGQWLHGTLGWGADKDKFIKKTKQTLINVVSDPRSSGCTRNNNEAIAYIRSMIDVGTPIIKVYAKEAIYDLTYKNYPNFTTEWNYVLTKNRNHAVERSQVEKLLNVSAYDLDLFWATKQAGGELILNPNSPMNQVLEVGKYIVDSNPDAIAYTPGEKLGKLSRTVGRNGNVYGVKSQDMHGIFYVDAGLLQDYAHPTNSVVEVSGFMDEVTPTWMNYFNVSNFR